MKETKEVDWEKRHKTYMKNAKAREKSLTQSIYELNERLEKEAQKNIEKKKGHTISLNAQIFTLPDHSSAKEKVKALVDAGVWYFEVGEK